MTTPGIVLVLVPYHEFVDGYRRSLSGAPFPGRASETSLLVRCARMHIYAFLAEGARATRERARTLLGFRRAVHTMSIHLTAL
jgi:hypothetical protein